jgi:pilus assembly protein Flp/PilA
MLKLYVKMQNALVALKKDDGQDLVEYALLGALIAVACVASVKGLATAIQAQMTAIGAAL